MFTVLYWGPLKKSVLLQKRKLQKELFSYRFVSSSQIRRELKQMINEQQQGSTRALSDMDARMTAIKQKINNMEDMLDAKVASVSHSTILVQLYRDKLIRYKWNH